MQFLRTVFWVIIAVLAVIFAFNNWIDVPVHLWGDIGTVWKLPFLLFAVFLLGLLPPWILHRVTRWSMRRKLETANRSLVETRAVQEVSPTHSEPAIVHAAPLTTPPTLL
jgi:putative membrane protein